LNAIKQLSLTLNDTLKNISKLLQQMILNYYWEKTKTTTDLEIEIQFRNIVFVVQISELLLSIAFFDIFNKLHFPFFFCFLNVKFDGYYQLRKNFFLLWYHKEHFVKLKVVLQRNFF
jgi:hypothetical protein